MRKMLAAFAVLMPLSAAAAGPLDGIYTCSLSIPSGQSQSYVTVNTNAEGATLFAVAALSPSQFFYGYGIGKVNGQTFNGNTMFGAPFALTLTGAGFAGTIGVQISGTLVTAGAYCIRVW